MLFVNKYIMCSDIRGQNFPQNPSSFRWPEVKADQTNRFGKLRLEAVQAEGMERMKLNLETKGPKPALFQHACC